MGFAFADAGNIWFVQGVEFVFIWFVQGVEFVFIFSLLSQDPSSLIDDWSKDFYKIFCDFLTVASLTNLSRRLAPILFLKRVEYGVERYFRIN